MVGYVVSDLEIGRENFDNVILLKVLNVVFGNLRF